MCMKIIIYIITNIYIFFFSFFLSFLFILNITYSVSDTATCSLYETIYSYRETVESEFPGYESQEAIDAFKMMKKLLDDLSNRIYFIINNK